MIGFKGSPEWESLLEFMDGLISDAKEENEEIDLTLTDEEVGRITKENLYKVQHYKGFKAELEAYVQSIIEG